MQLFKKLVGATLVFCISIAPVLAQDNFTEKEVKTLDKVEKLWSKEKFDKAVAKLKPVLSMHIFNGSLWESYTALLYDRYQAAYSAELDDMMKQLSSSFGSSGKTVVITIDNSTSTQYKRDYYGACSQAVRMCEGLEGISAALRTAYTEHRYDTAVDEDAKKKFDKGEKEFGKKNFSKAIKYYKEALELQPDYYKATLYIGDCLWNDDGNKEALPYYYKAIEMEPKLLEPRKYLVDAFMNLNEYDSAYLTCLEAMLVHPGEGMHRRMSEIADKQKKEYDRHWIPRMCTINYMGFDQNSVQNDMWKYYREAKGKVDNYCNDEGIITKKNSRTDSKYLEVYSWEYMLERADDDAEDLEFAREMQDAGYLDCYVFISLYHVDFDKQYKDFVENNAERVKEYINKYCIHK